MTVPHPPGYTARAAPAPAQQGGREEGSAPAPALPLEAFCCHTTTKVGNYLQDHRVQPLTQPHHVHHQPMSPSATSMCFLNTSRAGDSQCPGQPVPRPEQPFSGNISTNNQLRPPLEQLEAVSSHPVVVGAVTFMKKHHEEDTSGAQAGLCSHRAISALLGSRRCRRRDGICVWGSKESFTELLPQRGQ